MWWISYVSSNVDLYLIWYDSHGVIFNCSSFPTFEVVCVLFNSLVINVADESAHVSPTKCVVSEHVSSPAGNAPDHVVAPVKATVESVLNESGSKPDVVTDAKASSGQPELDVDSVANTHEESVYVQKWKFLFQRR
jgi:hypothetical protein